MMLVHARNLVAERGGEILLISQHDIHIGCDAAIDFLSLFLSSIRFPQGCTIVQVVGNNSAVSLCSLHGFQSDIGSCGGKGTEYPAGVEPARTRLSKNCIPIDVAGLEPGNRGVSAIIGSDGGPHSEPTLSKIETVSRRVTNSVVLDPAHQRLIDSSLVDEILKQSPHGVISECAD